MAGVDWGSGLAEWPAERDGEWLTKGDAESDPEAERRSPTVTELDLTDPRLVDTDDVRQTVLGESPTPATDADGLAEGPGHGLGQALRLAGPLAGSVPGRCGWRHEPHSYITGFAGHSLPITATDRPRSDRHATGHVLHQR